MSPVTVGTKITLLNPPQVEEKICSFTSKEYAEWNIFLILALLQVLDGVLTATGVSIFGTRAEGNLFLRQLMELFGSVPTLAVVKTMAILIVLALAQLQHQVSWVQSAVRGITLIYLFAAIFPWTWILLSHV
jgi:uncharacterized membrane protein